MRQIDLNLINDPIAKDVVGAVVGEPTLSRHIYDLDGAVTMWRHEINCNLSCRNLNYVRKACDRIVKNNPHLFSDYTLSNQYGATFYYGKALEQRIVEHCKAKGLPIN